MKLKGIFLIFIGSLIVTAFCGDAKGQSSGMIGNVTAVQREAHVIHPGQLNIELVKLGGSVLFKDLYETKKEAKLKLLFEDDSILTLGENSRLEINENIFDPDQGKRSTVLNLVSGSVRALVGKFFGGPDSRFEIHTPTAVAAARGTYFIVWNEKDKKGLNEKGLTGIVNIGSKGLVEAKNENSKIKGSVLLGENQYTMVEEGKSPTPAAPIDLKLLGNLLVKTEIKDQVAQEIPKGTEAPGSDVSMETVTSLPGQRGGTQQALLQEGDFEDSDFSGPVEGEETGIPPTPPIPQVPTEGGGGGDTHVTVTVDFP
ncbi:MAG TPA: FecR family protein [Nitrospiria bacterium]|jgi:hypothetical protein